MNKEKKKKIIIIVSIVISIILIIGLVYFFFFRKEEKVETPVKVFEILDSIDTYNYYLEDRDTPLYKEKFLDLKNVLASDPIDEEKYASLLSELYVIDLYTIDNKNSKYDVGSLDFIYEEEQEKFKNKIMDTMYKLVEDNSTNTRKQELPVVTSTEVADIEKINYTKKEQPFEGFNVLVNVMYEKDLGYDTKIKVTTIKEKDKIYVVSSSPIEE